MALLSRFQYFAKILTDLSPLLKYEENEVNIGFFSKNIFFWVTLALFSIYKAHYICGTQLNYFFIKSKSMYVKVIQRHEKKYVIKSAYLVTSLYLVHAKMLSKHTKKSFKNLF